MPTAANAAFGGWDPWSYEAYQFINNGGPAAPGYVSSATTGQSSANSATNPNASAIKAPPGGYPVMPATPVPKPGGSPAGASAAASGGINYAAFAGLTPQQVYGLFPNGLPVGFDWSLYQAAQPASSLWHSADLAWTTGGGQAISKAPWTNADGTVRDPWARTGGTVPAAPAAPAAPVAGPAAPPAPAAPRVPAPVPAGPVIPTGGRTNNPGAEPAAGPVVPAPTGDGTGRGTGTGTATAPLFPTGGRTTNFTPEYTGPSSYYPINIADRTRMQDQGVTFAPGLAFGPGGRSGLGFADGGPIVGPGGPRDDNLLIAASDGEFVIPADVVGFKGKEFFDKIIEKVRQQTGGPQEGGAPQNPTAPAPVAFADGGPVIGYANGGMVQRLHQYADGGLVTDPNDPNYLPPSGSPGLETLPAMGDPASVPAPGLALGQPVPMSDTEPIAPPPAPAAPAAPPATSGLGLADFKAARSEDDKAYLQSLPAAEKVGLMLQALGAGINGGPNPVDAKLEMKRRREIEFRNELRTNIATITTGMDAVRKLPPGKGRDALIEQIDRAAGGKGVVSEALKAVGTDAEAQIRNTLSTIKNPRVQKMLADAVAGSPDPRADALKLMGDKDFMDRAEKAADVDAMPSLTAKLRVISRALDEKMGLKTYTFAELAEQNAKLPKEFQLDDAELGAAKRNQDALQLYGMKSEKMLAEERAAATKREEKAAQSEERKSEREFAIRLTAEEGRRRDAEIERLRQEGRKDLEATKAATAREKDLDKKVSQLSQRLETAKLTETNAVLANVENIIAQDEKVLDFVAGPKSSYPDWMLGKEQTNARQAVAKLFNIELKNRSGAAVTVPEFERLKDEYGKGFFKKPEQLREAIKKARTLIENHYRGVAAGFEPEVLAKYNENLTAIGGKPVIDFSPSAGKPGDAKAGGDVAAQAKAAFGSYEPDRYEYGINPKTGKFARKPK